MFKPLIAYYRVSTREQGKSGLGLDAQRAAVARFAEAEGFEVVAEFKALERSRSVRSPPLSMARHCHGAGRQMGSGDRAEYPQAGRVAGAGPARRKPPTDGP